MRAEQWLVLQEFEAWPSLESDVEAEVGEDLHDIGCRIHESALQMLGIARRARRELLDSNVAVPLSVFENLELGAETATLLAQLSCQLQAFVDRAEQAQLGARSPRQNRVSERIMAETPRIRRGL